MRWADLDLGEGNWSKPASSTKQKEAHEVPLSAPARQLLGEIRERQAGKRHALGEFVFPGTGGSGHIVEIKKAWRRSAGLRASSAYASTISVTAMPAQLVSGGASLPLIGALLGHSTPTTTQRYAHLHHDPMREATERVGAAILAAGQPPKEPLTLKPRPHGR